jgi:hypothetical protein
MAARHHREVPSTGRRHVGEEIADLHRQTRLHRLALNLEVLPPAVLMPAPPTGASRNRTRVMVEMAVVHVDVPAEQTPDQRKRRGQVQQVQVHAVSQHECERVHRAVRAESPGHTFLFVDPVVRGEQAIHHVRCEGSPDHEVALLVELATLGLGEQPLSAIQAALGQHEVLRLSCASPSAISTLRSAKRLPADV